jgi:hypothetical protein
MVGFVFDCGAGDITSLRSVLPTISSPANKNLRSFHEQRIINKKSPSSELVDFCLSQSVTKQIFV